MNIVIILAGFLSLIAFIIHATIGDKEFCQLSPRKDSHEKLKNVWFQTRAGWHWVSVDLLFCGLLLLTIACTDFIQAKKEILVLLSIYYAGTGLVWFIMVFLSKASGKQFFVLGQWIFCFLQSGLIYYSTI